MMVFSVLALISCWYIVQSEKTDEPVCASSFEYEIIRKSNCRGFYLCVWGKPVEMPDCPVGMVFSKQAHTCVLPDNQFNDCIQEQYGYGDDDCIRPHPQECQTFYNCSLSGASSRIFEPYMDECPYPQFFNAETKRCDDFENVDCGTRVELKSLCQYRASWCSGAFCQPCNTRDLGTSCIGKEDGLNAHEYRMWSPYYVMCYKERTMSLGRCEPDTVNRDARFVHPSLNGCVSLDLIPEGHGGSMQVCKGQVDGARRDEFGRCDRYTLCVNGEYTSSQQCADGLKFDPASKRCRPAESFCGDCGNCPDKYHYPDAE